MSQSKEKYCGYGFLSAFTTIPGFKSPRQFFETEIDPIFSGHRENLATIIKRKNGEFPEKALEDETLYNPLLYCLFGDFDLAVFSLIDDFSFGTKKFRPSGDTKGFKYQVNTGVIPLVEMYVEDKQVPKFTDTRLPGLFSGKDVYAFTGIASIKLNNAMLVGAGQDFIRLYNLFLISYMDEKIKQVESQGIQLFYVMNENLGWNEITVYFFGSSMRVMQELLIELGQKTLKEIDEYLRTLDIPFDKKFVTEEATRLFETVTKESLLQWMTRRTKEEVAGGHPVVATSITFGYHIDLPVWMGRHSKDGHAVIPDPKQHKTVPLYKEHFEQPCLSIEWKVKPGHEFYADQEVQKLLPRKDEKLYGVMQPGKFQYRYPGSLISIKEYLVFVKNAGTATSREMSLHVTKFRSQIEWSSEVKYKGFDRSLHHYYEQTKYKISTALFSKIQKGLRDFPVSFTFKGQIENLISNYNDAVEDPLMYNYFIGLRPTLLTFLHHTFNLDVIDHTPDFEAYEPDTFVDDNPNLLGDFTDQPVERKGVNVADVSAFIQAWNKAYWNRYFHSYYFTEINDFNIEHHGGIQQILFAYDVIYKLISKRIYGKESNQPFVNVQVSPIIASTPYYNSVNFIHLFRPAIYACECVHEASNDVVPFLARKPRLGNFSFLLNPRQEALDSNTMAELKEFERDLLDFLAPKDEFELNYVSDYFRQNITYNIVADYLTYRLGYEEEGKGKIELSKKFSQVHWYLFLLRADLYTREDGKDEGPVGSWYFRVKEFRTIFIRFNLMLYLFFDITEDELLNEINGQCPSVELKPIWENEKAGLVNFVMRLGDALKKAINSRYEKMKEVNERRDKENKKNANDRKRTPTDPKPEEADGCKFEKFRNAIDEEIIVKGMNALSAEEQEAYKKAVELNQKLINRFHELFAIHADDRINILIRKAAGEELTTRTGGTMATNIDFFPDSKSRNIFIDPKGNIFSTSADIRKAIFMENVNYVKDMWDLSLKISLGAYKEYDVK